MHHYIFPLRDSNERKSSIKVAFATTAEAKTRVKLVRERKNTNQDWLPREQHAKTCSHSFYIIHLS